mmetsp:Transcript_20828/g.54113  ORF Transcript_20828/g.54113 Transcript_20828/m.54113 type:complete len:601 (+) Transcript_20828:56-1858(+)
MWMTPPVVAALGLAVAAVELAPAAAASNPPVFATEYGEVLCTRKEDTGVRVCHGIPFAAPPVHRLRWAPPRPPTPWAVPRNASVQGAVCPQLDFVRLKHVGSEDCLWLSVYTPAQCRGGARCAVMVWIHGGAWIYGSNDAHGAYDGSALAAKHGVVVVAANYRLDALGWLALDELAAETAEGTFGNYGLLDQEFALRWTRRNIGAFGGDPDAVTLFGQSAGGYSVCQHITRPGSNGLFSRAVMESGSCDGPWLIFDADNSKRWGSFYATKVGCPQTADPARRLACLRTKPVAAILEPYTEWLCPVARPNDPWCNRTASAAAAAGPGRVWPSPRPPLAPIIGWAATVDGTRQGLPEYPYRAMLRGEVNSAPDGGKLSVIFGTTADEMALFIVGAGVVYPGTQLPIAARDIAIAAEHMVAYHQPTWNSSSAASILTAYTGGVFRNACPAYKLVQMGTDFAFVCNTRQSAAALAAHGHSVHVYLFDFRGPKWRDPTGETCELESEVGCGVSHSAELPYVWQREGSGDDSEARVSAFVGTWWTNLARYGDPNGLDGLPTNGSSVRWPVYTAATPHVMRINKNPSVMTGLADTSRCAAWDALPPY